MVRGVLRDPNGEIYDGEIKDGKFNGYGKLYWPNGNWFEGIFKDGKPFKGILIYSDGKIAEYAEGELI